jgi:hypothetical protein
MRRVPPRPDPSALPGRRRARLLVAAAIALAAAGAPPRVRAADDAGELRRSARRYADLLGDGVAVLSRDPDATTLRSLLYDARRAVAEIDRLVANAAIYGTPPAERRALLDLAAGAHLNLALFETHGLEFERARQEVDRARALSGRLEDPGYRTAWVALEDGAAGRGLVTRVHALTLPDFQAALGSIWSRARAVSFEVTGYGPETVLAADLTRTPSPRPGGLIDRLVARGTTLFREALGRDGRSFVVPLPPGLYRLRGRGRSELDRSFIVPEASEVDPVVLDRARFSLRVEPRPGPAGPRFFLNGLEVTDLTTMPYGVYRVKADPQSFARAPQVVRFVLGEGITDKSASAWTIYVPGGTEARFQIERAPLGERILRH